MSSTDTMTREPLRWSETPPTVPGWYWIITSPEFEPEVVRVDTSREKPIFWADAFEPHPIPPPGTYSWAGPIPQPEESDRG